MRTNEDKLRDRYPHTPPVRSDYDTEEAYDEARLRFYQGQAELTEGIFSVMPFPVVSTLYDGTIVYANTLAQQMFGLTRDDLARHKAHEFLCDAEGKSVGDRIGRRILAHDTIRQETVYVRRVVDDRRELRVLTVTPIPIPGSQTIVRAVGFFQDPSIC